MIFVMKPSPVPLVCLGYLSRVPPGTWVLKAVDTPLLDEKVATSFLLHSHRY